MTFSTPFTTSCKVAFPIIMAPMFLISNEAMMMAAMRSGILGVFPSLNFRKTGELENILSHLCSFHNQKPAGSYGVNLIVQKTNVLYEKHLDICIKHKVPFYITSLGNPAKVINEAHKYGGKVYCDVTNMEHAEKCASLGCDGFIAVGHGAGGHAGPYALQVLIPSLVKKFPHIPVIAAGAIAHGSALISMLALGASGVSVGTRYIASVESPVSPSYKEAVIKAGMADIVATEKLSGTPCNIIDTPFARSIGYKQNWIEKSLSSSPKTRKYFKTLVQLRGMRRLELSVKPGNYSNLWSAGQSAELVTDILSCADLTDRFRSEAETTMELLRKTTGG
ncbi:MAG TPA: nitronate monooxygenase [Bacteroidia bacterium]|nr:nitronate monooxygenase [Bacteroidia bacterium]